MCGICGFYQPEARAGKEILKRMNDRIVHRGPDDEGFFYSGTVGLAARRLSIIDLVTGHQPLSSQSERNWITFNGEVYNFRELRSDLEQRGCRFRTRTDTEVVVNMYEYHGPEFVARLRGMFALGIYDQRRDRLVLARDHIGIKPLYYSFDPASKTLVFASEIKSILEYPGISRALDHTALDLFMTLEYIPGSFSIFQNIRKLPAGHYLIYEKGGISIHRYWELQPRRLQGGPPAWREELLELIRESVRMRMVSDVPLGAFLSGGIDSSAIVAAMSRLSNQPVQTFSIGFEEQSYSELPYSQIVAETFRTQHYTRTLSPDIEKLVVHLADFFDEPLGDFSNFPTYLVSRTAREKVTVVLSGDGGDEIFGGYEHYIAQKIARLIDMPLLRSLHRPLAKVTHLFPPSAVKKGMVNRVKRFSEGLENSHRNLHFRWMLFLSRLQKEQLYSRDFLSSEFLRPLPERAPFAEFFEKSKMFAGINRDLYLDLNSYLVDDILVKVDRASMATSLEARVPLLDVRLVEFAFSLPPRFKVRGGTTKWFFKQCMDGILPKKIIHRQKEGFSIPIKSWLRHELRDLMMEYLSEKRLKSSGFFNPVYVRNMIDEHLANRQNHSHRLWALILFHMWLERFAQGATHQPPP